MRIWKMMILSLFPFLEEKSEKNKEKKKKERKKSACVYASSSMTTRLLSDAKSITKREKLLLLNI